MTNEDRDVQISHILYICQQCAAETIGHEWEIEGEDNIRAELPSGWTVVWVADDEKAKVTCSGCIGVPLEPSE